ncbi:Cation/H(+) antiporter 28 [Rhynchospora pubera]|uniref:Cation/H(+) antiporter 28 n=1 Tax=Rhynchospora pubera TaxID=906938 RepID=A0AAV8EKB6_9POAL|nr:Cation/H(+) antiporter 28 [Rhynchospora pubera]
MDPYSVFDTRRNDGYIAYAGMLSTLAITAFSHKVLVNRKVGLLAENSMRANLGLGLALAATGSPMLTRLSTELKLSKTAVGQVAIQAGIFSDMVATSLMCLGNLIFHDDSMLSYSEQRYHPFYVALIVVQIIILMTASKWVLRKINDRNPEGKPMKGIYMIGLMTAVLSICFLDKQLHMDINLASFMIGLALPREGRVSRLLINNINFFLNSVILPVYLINICLSTIGKIFGTVISARLYSMKWLDGIALGQLLSTKGYFHIFCAYEAWNHLMINDSTFVALLYMMFVTLAITPLVGYGIAAWARRKAMSRLMGLQFHMSEAELRLMVGLHGPQNLPIMLTLVEAVRWNKEPGKVTLYTTDMIELTEHAAVTLIKGDGQEGIEVMDEEVLEMRNHIGGALNMFQQKSNDEVNVRRLLAISSFDDMDRDICMCADDVKAVLIILPFHKSQRIDGSMNAGHAGFKLVNEKVLQHAPCSVGILVDRGLGHTNQGSHSLVGKNVVIVFIGGGDDREALTLATQMCQHPAIKLTVIRFLPDVEALVRESPRSHKFSNFTQTFVSKEDVQMQLDNEFFADFYNQHIANREVGYVEKHVMNGAELAMELRELESQYELFVVGKGRDRKSILTDGLEEWAECPELGPIGDIVASSDFSTTASALIIQQYDAKKHYKVIDEEFMPFR